jgi:hypothetical protein
MENQSLVDGLIAAFAAILESMPQNQRVSAAGFARAFIQAGIVGDEHSRRFIEGLFLLPGNNEHRPVRRRRREVAY